MTAPPDPADLRVPREQERITRQPDGTWTAESTGMRSLQHPTAVDAALVFWPLWANTYHGALDGVQALVNAERAEAMPSAPSGIVSPASPPCSVCAAIAEAVYQGSGMRSNHLPSDVESLIRVYTATRAEVAAATQRVQALEADVIAAKARTAIVQESRKRDRELWEARAIRDEQRIEALEAQLARQGWQPIDTAPKDGQPVLGFMPSYYQGRGGQSVILWMDTNGRGGRWFDNRAWETDPTHWQPLPPAPAQTP